MGLELADIKLYVRLNGCNDIEDSLLKGFVDSAIVLIKEQSGKTEYMVNGEPNPIEENDLFQLGVKMLVAHWYDNRGMALAGTIIAKIPYSAETIIHHISLSSMYI